MAQPAFDIRPINLGSTVLNDRGRTVAVISPQGYIDWLLPGLDQPGPLVHSSRKEAHLSWANGLLFRLHLPGLTETIEAVTFDVMDGGARALIAARSRSDDGLWTGVHRAQISANESTGRYEWMVETSLSYDGEIPVERAWIEYNNVYPSGTGRCMLFAPGKRFHRTLMVDRDGAVWDFPHQHVMHYATKIRDLHFAVGSVAGFFGEALNPVVVVERASLEPDWQICDMYYDLHCGARLHRPVQPGEKHEWAYRIRYLDQTESQAYLSNVEHLPISAADYERFRCARLDLGRNTFRKAVRIDDEDDASGFRPNPPQLVWDRETGLQGTGSLRITNEAFAETVWSAAPPSQIPSRRRFRLRGLMKADGVEGKGLFLRVRYHTFTWHPKPHVEWVQTMESDPVTGTTDWVRVETPVLTVPGEHFDYLVWIDFVLDGTGTGWLTDVDVDLQSVEAELPVAPRTPVRT